MVTVIIIGILAILIAFIGYGSWTSQQWHREHLGEEVIVENDHFYARIFYFNPEDKRIFPPKRTVVAIPSILPIRSQLPPVFY